MWTEGLLMGSSVGTKLRQTREYLGLTCEWVAAQVGITTARLEAIESGDCAPTEIEITICASKYRYPVDHFSQDPVGPDPQVLVLTRASKKLNDIDILGIQRFSEFLRAYGKTRAKDGPA
jgi:DNA-binding XRE family transcriptional regulator